MMSALPALIVVWAVFTGLFLALLAYNGTLTRYEENQLFLDDINANEKQQQSTILNKITKVTPYIKALDFVRVDDRCDYRDLHGGCLEEDSGVVTS
jgi:hypothetical protein